ncbi:LRR receptor-like serine/threonine-protein kinase IOS1 [Carica papaya]|uniref:LRR receptor-like serine/threonine-protein kinase IOS1 n=1 Tax=Carica papaya TaxID=3649 RepID=UPI000B8CEB11|nr:LRR receptor-like serine/threonine-protein kinase IOS1 [Carica papaya]
MGIRLWFLLVSVAVVLLLVQAQNDDQSGFISLDCGSPKGVRFVENKTKIVYTSDESFIDTGEIRNVSAELQPQFQQQMWNLRSFPQGIRNCYRLNLTKGSKYLIRASFLYGNYDGLNQLPQFDLYLGPNLWGSVAIQNASIPVIREMIHVISSDHLHVCLVNTDMGIPFISALELRLLRNTTYITESGSLELFTRFDVAGSALNQTAFRFNKDAIDRTWVPFSFQEWAEIRTSNLVNIRNDYLPPEVGMQTAAIPKNASKPLLLSLEPSNRTSHFYVYMHFAEIQVLLPNETREFNITYNGQHWFGPFSPPNFTTTTIFSPSALLPLNGSYEFSIFRTNRSTHPPLLNAIELYSVKELSRLETDQTDADAMLNIKSAYGLKENWEGDPCAPQEFVWHGLKCFYPDGKPPRVTSLNLSSLGLSGNIFSDISNLSELADLDLSNNNLTGGVPDFLAKMVSLKVLRLDNNRLTGSIPPELIQKSDNHNLTLSFEGNPGLCGKASCKKSNKVVVPVVASVASFSVIVIVAGVTMWIIRRKKRAGMGEIAHSRGHQSLVLSNNRRFSYSEVLKITNNFQRVLGKGGFGTVYHGYLDDTQVAVKMLSPSSVQGYKQFQAEVELLLRVHHRNLTSLVGYCDEGTDMALIYEYMAKGNLDEHISERSRNIMSWERRLQVVLEAAQGLEYLHYGCKPPIIHRDVKTTNILLNDNLQAKLADFGLSRTFMVEGDTHVSTVVAGTPGYLDPEYYLSNRLTEKSDVYSFGVVLLEVITGRSVIMKTHEKIHISQWVSSMLDNGDIKKIVDPRLVEDFDINSAWKVLEVAMACVSPTSFERPTMTQVVAELKECLAAETARTNYGSPESDSKESINLVAVSLASQQTPLAR